MKNILPIASIIISIIAIIVSWSANHKANETSKDSLIFQKESESIDRVQSTYNKIMYWWLRDIWMTIYNSELIIWRDMNFQLFIDELEWLASVYCDWKIKEQHMSDNFKTILHKTCNNKQVIKVYWWKKNWLSKLCTIYDDEYGMWQFYKNEKCKKFE